METFSALLALCAVNSPVTVEFPSQRPVTRNFVLYLICAWTNSWVNNRDAGYLRRNRVYYDAIVIGEGSTGDVVSRYYTLEEMMKWLSRIIYTEEPFLQFKIVNLLKYC